jgi:hypothetical protein
MSEKEAIEPAKPRKIEAQAPSVTEARGELVSRDDDHFAAFERGEMTGAALEEQRLERRFDELTDMGSQLWDILQEESEKAKSERPRQAGAKQMEHDISRAGSIIWRFLTE